MSRLWRSFCAVWFVPHYNAFQVFWWPPSPPTQPLHFHRTNSFYDQTHSHSIFIIWFNYLYGYKSSQNSRFWRTSCDKNNKQKKNKNENRIKRTTEKNMNISQCLPGIWCIRSPFFCCCPMCASLTLYEYIAERHKTANKYTWRTPWTFTLFCDVLCKHHV